MSGGGGIVFVEAGRPFRLSQMDWWMLEMRVSAYTLYSVYSSAALTFHMCMLIQFEKGDSKQRTVYMMETVEVKTPYFMSFRVTHVRCIQDVGRIIWRCPHPVFGLSWRGGGSNRLFLLFLYPTSIKTNTENCTPSECYKIIINLRLFQFCLWLLSTNGTF